VENTRGIPRFQELCERYGIRPTYLIDTPVVEDERSVEMLRGIEGAGRCEVGAHLHPWCAPPHDEKISTANSFMCNLSEPLQYEKVRRLSSAIEERVGIRPTSFRAGRYGFDWRTARVLDRLGYIADSSVIPFSDFSSQQGPCFEGVSWLPYYFQNRSRSEAIAGPGLLELPVSVGFNRNNFTCADRVRRAAATSPLRQLRAVGVLDRLGLVKRIKFSPEQSDARNMMRLIDVFMAQRAPCMVMMLHSSSLVAGGSPYVPDAAGLERLYSTLERTFEHAQVRHQMRGMTLSAFARQFGSRTAGN
jgi:hypothetical protein